VTSPRVLCAARHLPQPKNASTFRADVAAAARAVAPRRRCLPAASSTPARAARRSSAPLACPRHHRDLTPCALRCQSSRRSPRARRPSAPTPPLPPAPSWRVDAGRLAASSAPAALAARRVSAPLAPPRHHRDLTLRALRCPSPRRRPRASRPPASTSPLPPVPSWRVDAARPVASPAPARAARRLSAPLARPRHHRDTTLRALRWRSRFGSHWVTTYVRTVTHILHCAAAIHSLSGITVLIVPAKSKPTITTMITVNDLV